jgi:hypothetical protein
MRRVTRVTIGCLLAAVALPSPSHASPYNRDCGTSRDGWVVGDFNSENETPWEVSGPWHIRMTNGPRQAQALLKRFPVQEFNTHVQLGDVPCMVAQGIALSASQRWPRWPAGAGSVRVTLGTSGGDAQLGRYRCTSRNLQPPSVAKVTCWTWLSGGNIRGTFVISQNPYA